MSTRIKANRSTPAQREQAAAWREAGRSIPWIARQLGFSKGAVDWWLLCSGAEKPGARNRPLPTLTAVRRGAHMVRPFTPDEDALLLRLENQGLTNANIARAMIERDPTRPRAPNTIKARLMILARRQERAMQEAAE